MVLIVVVGYVVGFGSGGGHVASCHRVVDLLFGVKKVKCGCDRGCGS